MQLCMHPLPPCGTFSLTAITQVKENGGGNTPNGNANGVPTVAVLTPPASSLRVRLAC